MGITGTEVSKEASDIILMDDNFNSIVKAMIWGRAVNDSVRKFLQFQLTVNLCAVVLAFVSAVTDPDNQSVLSATQLLWVNLIMDTLAALALATEKPNDGLIDRYPISKGASLISFTMWKMIIGQAVFQVVTNLFLIRVGPSIFHLGNSKEDRALMRTIVFNTFVFLQVFNEINCRRVDEHFNVFRGILKNYSFFNNPGYCDCGAIFHCSIWRDCLQDRSAEFSSMVCVHVDRILVIAGWSYSSSIPKLWIGKVFPRRDP